MIKTPKETGLKLGRNSQRHLYKPAHRVKEEINSGKIGKAAIGTIILLGWHDRDYYESDDRTPSYFIIKIQTTFMEATIFYHFEHC